jgi:acyl-CoA synthetase (AMP-forming)/AMP-acid ligase II
MQAAGNSMSAHTDTFEGLRTVGGALDEQVAHRGDAPFLVAGDRTWTFREVADAADAMAAGLYQLGVEPGDRMAIDLPNWPEFVISVFAAARLGAVIVPLNPGYTSRELQFMLRNSEATVVVAAERFEGVDYLELFESLLFELPDLQYLVTVGEEDLWYDDRIFQFEDLVSSGRGRDLPRFEADPDGDSFAIFYTPGTTGKPKGVMLSHTNLVRTAVETARALGLEPGDATLCSVPLFHIFGLGAALLTSVVAGARLVLQERFDTEATLALIEEHGISVLHGVPTMFVMLLREEGLGERDLGSLRTGIIAGAPVGEALVRQARRELVPQLEIAYGLTETSPTVTITRPEDDEEHRSGSVGRPLDGVEVRLLDDGGEPVSGDAVGEVAVRGFNVMLGYFRQPAETASSFTRDGFFRTGDLARRDSKGYLQIVGRKSDVIIRGGYNVHPREVENHLRSHPAVLDAVVVGVPNEVLGELVCACVRPVEGAIITGEELRGYCRSALASYKVPDLVRFMDVFPMTAAGKPRRVEIARMVRAEAQGSS